MHIKKAYMKKGVGGHFEEVVKGLFPKETDYAEVQHNVSGHEYLTDEILHVLEGSIHINLEGDTTIWRAGERVFLPKHIIHPFKTGPGGCTYAIILKE